MKTSAKIAIAAAIAIAGTTVAGSAWAHREGRMHGGSGMHGGGMHGMMHGGGQGYGMHGGGHGWKHRRHGRGHGMRAGRYMMERYDANKDGKLTQEEIDSNREAWLKEFDANNDGKLSLDEFKQLYLKARAERIVREFQQFDRDGDATVTLDEYKDPLADIVESMDRNGDGALSKEDRRGRGKWRRRMMQCDQDAQNDDGDHDATEGGHSGN